jgi:hypothetical protein
MEHLWNQGARGMFIFAAVGFPLLIAFSAGICDATISRFAARPRT